MESQVLAASGMGPTDKEVEVWIEELESVSQALWVRFFP